MKKLLILLLLLTLLCGCAAEREETGQSTDGETTSSVSGQDEPSVSVETNPEPTEAWIEANATPWDREGALVELEWSSEADRALSYFMEFDGDLLLWGYDTHFSGSYVLELCLIELDDGSVAARGEVALQTFVSPQVLNDSLFLCDEEQGVICELDKTLREVNRWEAEQSVNSRYMGQGHLLYELTEDSRLRVRDLDGGSSEPLLAEDPEVSMFNASGATATLEYYHPETGEKLSALLDLETGEVTPIDLSRKVDYITAVGDCWLGEKYLDGYIFYLSREGAEPQRFTAGDEYFHLMEDVLLETSEDGCYLHLYDLQGKAISSCHLSENGTYHASILIRSDLYHGYFIVAVGDADGYRLLFWDTESEACAEDVVFTSIPTPSEAEAALQERCDALGNEYGLTILVGENCDTEFGDFTASIETDWDKVSSALDTLEETLSEYPENFFRQLHYGTIHGVRIQLVSDLQADGNGRYGGGYAAFVSSEWDHALMVVDIDVSGKSTYYHEFSHVIDRYLEWDAIQRQDALFSEEGWAANNPDWFSDYTYDYANSIDLYDYDAFTDPYATISPTEDRARVLEYAMSDYGEGTFAGTQGLYGKLEYYCRCIRDAFDTTGWAETVLWERYL